MSKNGNDGADDDDVVVLSPISPFKANSISQNGKNVEGKLQKAHKAPHKSTPEKEQIAA